MDFSQRYGHARVLEALRPDEMPDTLRISLWNTLQGEFWGTGTMAIQPGVFFSYARKFWFEYLKRPYSEIPSMPGDVIQTLQARFFACKWHEAYDFTEATLKIANSQKLDATIAHVLAREKAAYRLIDRQFVQLTDPAELQTLGEAIDAREGTFTAAAVHLQRAAELYSDRVSPDYRNSIKESISAVEAVAKVVSGKTGAELGDALAALERNGKLHGALKKGFSALYGYASDANGIRHALMDEPNLTAAEAKSFLLACSSFVNYLKAMAP